MYLEALTVCVNYSDFLRFTLPETLQHVDRLIVVTTPSDEGTRSLCRLYGVECVDTELFYEDGQAFNKAAGINLGLTRLRSADWILHLDADVLLPHRLRDMLGRAKLDPAWIYGCDRLNVKSYDDFVAYRNKMVPQFKHGCLVVPQAVFPVGSRLVHNDYGYCPIGFFQLWHASQHRQYPKNHGTAARTDVLHAMQWPRERRALLPECFVYHLESEQADMGANWSGRTTEVFGPSNYQL